MVEQGVMSYLGVCLIPAPFCLIDLWGILTGARILACVVLLATNRKAGTKPMCLWSLWTHLGIFSALLYKLSYINGSGELGKERNFKNFNGSREVSV